MSGDVRQFAPVTAYDDGANRQRPKRILTGVAFADMRVRVENSYLIKTLLQRGCLAGIVGPSGSGKTFLGTDLAVHIAANIPWRGHRIAGGLVVYAALEGAQSAEYRFTAARDVLKFEKGIPLVMTPDAVNLRDPRDVDALVEFTRAQETTHGAKVAAIFVDTLSRAMSGGDENSSEDMTSLIAGCDAVRVATGAAVVLVHHCGKDESRGARGHSSFKAALDTEIEVTTTGSMHVATATKQRDLPSGTAYAFTLEVVELARDDEGDAITTCVVRVSEAPVSARKAPTGKNQAALLAALQEWQRSHVEATHISSIDYRAIAKAQGIGRQRLPEVTQALVKGGWLVDAVGGYSLLLEVSP